MIRVYSFGCHAPVLGADLLSQQLRLAHLYYNELIAVERARRQAYRERCDDQSDELRDISCQIEACVATMVAARMNAADERMIARSRRGASDDSRDAVEQAKRDLAWLWEERDSLIRAEKREDAHFVEALEALDEHAHAEGLRLYREYGENGHGLFWGTQSAIKESIEQARKSHFPPHFRSGGGRDGQIAVTDLRTGDHAGLPVADVFGSSDTRLRIAPIPPGAYDSRSNRRRLTRTAVRIRAGRDEGQPLWIEFPVVIHRELPRDGLIKRARISVRREASHLRYQLQLTVESKPPAAVIVDRAVAVGIDLGWRWQDQVRVAYTVDARGEHCPVSLANDVVAAYEHAKSLRSIRDKNMELIKADLAGWLKEHNAPGWLRERTKGLHAIRAASSLASIMVGWWKDGVRIPGWRDNRFAGDERIFDALEMWRKQDKHLWEWEHNERRKALARRLEAYRVWASQIASTYSLVAIEDFDLRESAKKPPSEEPGEHDDLARQQRIVSAPSLLRSALINACTARGVTLVKVPCAATTITCHACNGETRWDAAKYLSHRCECGAIWDQDYNAAVNILREGLAKWTLVNVGEVEEAPRMARWKKIREASKAKATRKASQGMLGCFVSET